jgi:hypothetical protein
VRFRFRKRSWMSLREWQFYVKWYRLYFEALKP